MYYCIKLSLLMKRFDLKSYAFSLVELTISLVVISCIAAAFAPVVTKKLKNSNVSVALSEVVTRCDKFSDECSLCYASKCIVCDRLCNDNQYKNVGTCACENCTDRSVGCIRCDAKVCTRCASGYGLTSDGKCRLCQKGYYSDGTFDCKPCPVDKYQNQTGKSSCINCPANQGSDGAAAACTVCSTKISNCSECSNLSQCTKCKAGYYLSAGACYTCPQGYKCDGSATKTICSAGTFSLAGASSCTTCSAGYYQNLAGQTSCKTCSSKTANCTNCNVSTGTCTYCANKYYLSSSSCALCTAGYKCVNNVRTQCAAGYYAPAGSTSCTACASGYYSAAGASSCKACSSTWSRCSTCSINGCATCKSGYVLSGGSCIEETSCWEFHSNSVWTVPSYAKNRTIYIYSCGGGGANSGQGGGGGMGGFKYASPIVVTQNQLTIVVGAAGVNSTGGGGASYINEFIYNTAACGGGGSGSCGSRGSTGGNVAGSSCTPGAGGTQSGSHLSTNPYCSGYGGYCTGGAGVSCQSESRCEAHGGYFHWDTWACSNNSGRGGNGSGANTTYAANIFGTGYCNAANPGGVLISLYSIASKSSCKF